VTPRGQRAIGLLLAVSLAVGLGGCGPGQDQLIATALHDAARTLASEPFGFRLDVDTDDAAAALLQEQVGPLGPLMVSAAVRGIADGDRLSLSVELLGITVLDVRSIGAGELFVRLDLGSFAELLGEAVPAERGATLGETVGAQLLANGVEGQVAAAIVAATDGRWVALTTGAPILDSSQTGTGDGASALGLALAEVLRAAVVTGTFGELRDGTPADVLLDIELSPSTALGAALAVLTGLDPTGVFGGIVESATPSPVPLDAIRGSLILDDGQLETMTFELAGVLPALLDDDVVAGSYVLTLDMAQANEVLPIERPPAVATLTLAELRAAVAALNGQSAPQADPVR
jgi:hypothetical protein